MIPPQDIKKKDFSRVMRGYDPVEVDEYYGFIVDNYAKLYAQCDSYDRKLRIVAERISEMQAQEDSIKKLAVSTQNMCDNMTADARAESSRIVAEAKSRAADIIRKAETTHNDMIDRIKEASRNQIEAVHDKCSALLMSTKKHCADLLLELKEEIAKQKEAISVMQKRTGDFNAELLGMYKVHIKNLLEDLPAPMDMSDLDESVMLNRILSNIKADMSRMNDMSYLDEITERMNKLEYINTDRDGGKPPRDPESLRAADADMMSETVGRFISRQETQQDPAPEAEEKSAASETAVESADEEIRVFVPHGVKTAEPDTVSIQKPIESEDKAADFDELENDYINIEGDFDYDDSFPAGEDFDEDADLDDLEEAESIFSDYKPEKNGKKKKSGLFGLFSKKRTIKKFTEDDEDDADIYEDEDELDAGDGDDFYGFNESKSSSKREEPDIFDDIDD